MFRIIYYVRSSQLDVDGDIMRQRFIDEFRLYEEKLLKNTERDYFYRHRANDTLRNLYFRVVKWICTTVVGYMTRFHNQEKETTAKGADTKSAPQIGKKVPLSTVNALYKMKEYYVPVYDAVSYDVELLCIACKL